MSDSNYKKVNVLGIPVLAIQPEKAAKKSLEMMRSKELHSIYFLSAGSSLYAKENSWAADVITSCAFVLPGDKNMEEALFSDGGTLEKEPGLEEYTDYYLNYLFYWLEKENRTVYSVVDEQKRLDIVKDYFKENYRNISADGLVFKDYDITVNEINAVIPDILLLCLPVKEQVTFLKEYVSMMNTRLVIAIDTMETHFHKGADDVPSFVQMLHLEKVYHWIKKDQKHQETVVSSLFKNKVAEENQESAFPGDKKSDKEIEIVQSDEDSSV